MVSLQDVQLQNHLTLTELGKAVTSMMINPNSDYEITAKDSKRIADWTIGYREFDFQEVIMAQIVFFTAVAIAMLIVLVNSFQMKYQGKHGKGVSDDEY